MLLTKQIFLYWQKLKKKLGALLHKGEIFWKQRVKQFWLKEGDKNNRFFHNMASARRKANKITKLQRDDGSWAENKSDIQGVVKEYFMSLFKANEDELDYGSVLNRVRCLIRPEVNNELTRPFHMKEFREAICQMHPDKSPGPDGFNPASYQWFWDILKDAIFASAVEWLTARNFPGGLMATNVVLISKVERAP